MKKFLICLALCSISLSALAKSYNVIDYGAVGDTTVLSSKAMQMAIDECSANGGGTVYVPAGNYLCATILLKSNVDFHLAAGATIYASRKSSDYKDTRIRVGATDASLVEVLLAAFGVQNISVSGTGTLNGQAVREQFRRESQQGINTDFVTGREITNAAKYGVDYQTKYRKVPPCPGVINFTNCTNVHIDNIQVIESSFWSVHLQWCDRVFVRGISIYSNPSNGVNADGLDIDGCRNVLISDCVINTGDDGLCLKTTRQGGESRPCEFVTVTNCVLTSSSAALKLGTESFSAFRNITVSNCVINDANRGINMIIRDGGEVSDILFSNLIINTVRKATFWWGNGDAIWITVQEREKGHSAGGVKNVFFQNIIAHSQSGIRLEGFDSTIENVRFTNVQLFMQHEDAIDKRSKHGFEFMSVEKLQLTDCEVIWDKERPEQVWQSAFYFDRVKDLRLDGLRLNQSPELRYPAVEMKHVTDAMIENCRLSPGMKQALSVDKTTCKGIEQINNRFSPVLKVGKGSSEALEGLKKKPL
jgi:hypothetical protein